MALVCEYLHRPVPVTLPKKRVEKGRKELLSIKGLTSTVADKLITAGVINGDSLLAADAHKLSTMTGVDEDKIRTFQTIMRKKQENAIIQL